MGSREGAEMEKGTCSSGSGVEKEGRDGNMAMRMNRNLQLTWVRKWGAYPEHERDLVYKSHPRINGDILSCDSLHL